MWNKCRRLLLRLSKDTGNQLSLPRLVSSVLSTVATCLVLDYKLKTTTYVGTFRQGYKFCLAIFFGTFDQDYVTYLECKL